LAYAIHGVVGAPYAGMFALGMLVPWSNTFVSFIPNFWCLFYVLLNDVENSRNYIQQLWRY